MRYAHLAGSALCSWTRQLDQFHLILKIRSSSIFAILKFGDAVFLTYAKTNLAITEYIEESESWQYRLVA
jgi:hypothetical protein